jgi:AcrR family transcriptional regulator
MVSQHRNSHNATIEADAAASAHNAIDDDRILDAAYPLFLAVGPRRMTMADVARHTDVSRATLYRRWPNVRSLVAAMVTREWSALATHALNRAAPDARTRLVNGVIAIALATREHPLLRMIVELDPEFLLPYLLERRGTSTDMQLTLLEHAIRAGMTDGSIRTGDAGVLAQAVLLATTSFVLSGRAITHDLDALDKELRMLLDRYLRP